MTQKIPVAVLGATGSVGQRFVALLAEHPWFEIASLCASERSAGRRYADAANWVQSAPLPPWLADRVIEASAPPLGCPLVFSALDASVAGEIESSFARAGHLVVSNAGSHRMAPDVPLLVPEVNPGHLDLLDARDGSGSIITNPNCSTVGLVMALSPLARAFGVDAVHVVTLQAVSGAGLPGVSGLEILDNIIPFIEGEEGKMEAEALKILGSVSGGSVSPASMVVSAQCNRVPVVDGHTLCVAVKLRRQTSAPEILDAWRRFTGEPQERCLPSAPERPVHVMDRDRWPQPRLHRGLEGGMAVSVGRLRPCPVMDWKFVTLSHNTVRGAAGGAILAAELAVARGHLPDTGGPA